MKASFGKKIAIFCLSAAMAVGIGFGFSGIEAAQAHTAEKDIVLDSYKLDSVITVSDSATTGVVFPKTVKISDTEIATAYVITYPNGVSLSVTDGIVLDQVGLYTITYKSVVGGVSNVYTDTFKVYNNFANDTDLVELYEKNVYSAYETMPDLNGDGKFNGNDGAYYGKYNPEKPTADATVTKTIKGIRAKLSPGYELEFNKIVNVNNVRSDGFCELVVFNPNAVNRATNSLIFNTIDFTFTDVNDPNNFIKVTIDCYWASIGYSFGASTNDLPLVGIRNDGNISSSKYDDDLPGVHRIFYIDGVKYVAFLNSTGAWGASEQSLYDYKILYNPITQEIKRECVRHYNFENGKTDVVNTKIVVDLDNPDIYDDGAKLFSGFSTGEVKVSVEARNFEDSSGYCEFYGVGDTYNEDLRAMYSEDALDDTKSPELKVDVKQTDANGVYALYNANNPVKFKIPSSIVYDASDISDLSVRVYKNYSDPSRVFVPTNADGTFTVADNSIYTIEYSATDAFGNVGYTTLTVVPRELSEFVDGDVKIEDSISSVFDKIQLTTGKQFTGEILKQVNTINLASDLKVKVSVKKGNEVKFAGEYVYADFQGEEKPVFNIKPLELGIYTVTYEFSDNVTNLVYSYDVNCVSENLVDFAEAPLVQNYYILGMTYEKLNFTAYKFGNKVTENPTEMYVSYDEGANWTKVIDTFVMGQKADGSLITDYSTVKFKYVSEGVDDLITASAPIVDVRTDAAIANNEHIRVKQERVDGVVLQGNIDQVKYFVGTNALISKSTINTVVSNATVNSGSAVTRFINPLSIDTNGSFYFEFATNEDKNNYNELRLRYIDAYDPTNVFEVKYFMNMGSTRVSVQGAKDVAAGINLYGSKFQTYLSLSNQIFYYGTNRFNIDFHPTNNLFYVELELSAINGDNAELTVTTIGNHKFQLARTIDSSSPMLYFESSAGSYSINTEVTIKVPLVIDVLTPYVHNYNGNNRTRITVMKDKQYAKDVNGVLLDGTQDPLKEYTILLSEYATWDVKYEVSDAAGKMQSPSFSISAVDTVPPVIELNYGFNADTIHNVTLGKPFSIEYNITDNFTDSTRIKSHVMIFRDSDYFNVYNSEPFETLSDPSTWTKITDTCTLTRKGIYTVHIFAMDEDSNATFVTYKLNVQ